MQLYQDKLASHLQQKLAPVYFVHGDETLLINESCDLIRHSVRCAGFQERERFYVEPGFNWEKLAISANSLSLFAEKKLLEVRLEHSKLDDKARKSLLAYCADIPDDKILLVICHKLDASQQKSKWFKTIDKHGVCIAIKSLNNNQFNQWIRQRLQKHGFKPTPAVIQCLAERVEGNLLACAQEIDKLALLVPDKQLTPELITEIVIDNTRYDIFKLCDTALSGAGKKALNILTTLRLEGVEPILISWALTREIRMLANLSHALQNGQSLPQLLQQYRVWSSRQSLVTNAIKSHSKQHWQQALQKAAKIDGIIKGVAAGNLWDEIKTLCLMLTPKSLPQEFNYAR